MKVPPGPTLQPLEEGAALPWGARVWRSRIHSRVVGREEGVGEGGAHHEGKGVREWAYN